MDSLRIKEEPHEDVSSTPTPRPLLRTGRVSRRTRGQRGVRTEPALRPSELLEKIGILGKDVVTILKDCGWEVCEPRALQHHKRYYAPGGRAKGERAVHKRDFFVGEGELYAHVLDRGGINAFKPGVLSPPMIPSSCPPSPPSLSATVSSSSCMSDEAATAPTSSSREGPFRREAVAPGSQKRKRRRRKSLPSRIPNSTTRGLQSKRQQGRTSERTATSTSGEGGRRVHDSSAEPTRPATALPVPRHFEDVFTVETNDDMSYRLARVAGPRGCKSINSQTSAKMHDWRFLVLRAVELDLLRFVAMVQRYREPMGIRSSEQRSALVASDHAESDADDSCMRLQELDDLAMSMDGSQQDLWTMVAAITTQDNQQHEDGAPEPAGYLHLPSFSPQGCGGLLLLGEMDRHLLRLVATVRRYCRAKSPAVIKGKPGTIDGDSTAACPATRGDWQEELDSLQRSIQESLVEVREFTNEILEQVRAS